MRRMELRGLNLGFGETGISPPVDSQGVHIHLDLRTLADAGEIPLRAGCVTPSKP